MKRKQVVVIVLALISIVLFCVAIANKRENTNNAKYIYEKGKIFGTFYTVTYESPTGESLQIEIEAEMHKLDSSLSMFNKQSTISKINRSEPNVEPDELFKKVFLKAIEVYNNSNGAFDITVGPLVNAWGFGFKERENITKQKIDSILQFVGSNKISIVNNHVIKQDPRIVLDASAIAKGYGSDLVASYFDKKGITNYMIEIGGEVAAKGHSEKQRPWRIGVNKPIDDNQNQINEVQAVIELTSGGLATSGNYRNFYIKDGKKYAHTIDPKSGYPVQHSLLSATIIASECGVADAYATACMVLGVEKSLELCRNIDEIEGYFIYDNNGENKIIFSDGFDKFILKQ